MQSPPDQHQPFPYSTTNGTPLAPQHTAVAHSHMRELEYPPSEQPSRSAIIAGYAAYSGAASHAQVTPHMAPQALSQMQQSAQFSPSAHSYPSSESDANYWRIMFRELGFGESADGGAYPNINGYSSTMPDIGTTTSNASRMNGAYQAHQAQEPHVSSHTGSVNGHNPYNGNYAPHPTRHYQPYPQPSYSGHPSQHPGYGELVGGR
ncbi:hypothetical protein BC835DRAFT_1046087 [Cytidiella melzeri]|nr:hypothetical protein BC835DRAFT_1046087 [Cytidiella melzeri]